MLNKKLKFGKLLSGILSAVMMFNYVSVASINADENTEMYPYTVFASSSDEGAITINANNVCINGDIATNGTIVTTSPNFNVNGTKTEDAGESMIHVENKLNYMYFSDTSVEVYHDDYNIEELNIIINNPMSVNGNIEMTGNINLNSGIKANEDVNLYGEVKNSNNSVIFSETGNININTSNVNYSGLIYAPYGNIVIDTNNLNLNNAILIGQTITINCSDVNANYNSSMASIVGTESDVDASIYVVGLYNLEMNSIEIIWDSTYKYGEYTLWYSDDNEHYVSFATVSDVSTYAYAISDDFTEKFFKVSLNTDYGEYVESNVFSMVKSEDGYTFKPLDTDNDGLPDVLEIMYGTSIDVTDTDKDGLSDYQEVFVTQTNPTIYDSVIEGISDADVDIDEDGLSNISELNYETNPSIKDTDLDDISDYDELFTYGTDPLVKDTDGDGLNDLDELNIGLDPANPETFGYPDLDYKIVQTIPADSDVLKNINRDDNAYELSIEMKTNGCIANEIRVSESNYSATIDNDAIIGFTVEVTASDICNPEDVLLKFNIKDEYINNTVCTYSDIEEFQGIKRLNVFHYYEDKNMLLPVETEFDTKSGLMYAEVDELGTYCIMDMEIWFDNLGIVMTDEQSNISTVALTEPIETVKTLDLVFLLQTTGSSTTHFNKDKALILDFCNYVLSNRVNSHIYIVTYDFNKGTLLKPSDEIMYFSSISDIKNVLNSIEYTDGVYDYCDRGQAFKIMQTELDLREDSDIFIYRLVNGATTSSTSVYDVREVLDLVSNNTYRAYSEISFESHHYIHTSTDIAIHNMIANNDDLAIAIENNTCLQQLIDHLNRKSTKPEENYEVLLTNNWETVKLSDELNPDNGNDTDGDCITDWEELDTSWFVKNGDGSYSSDDTYLTEFLDVKSRFYLAKPELLSAKIHTLVAPAFSIPTVGDSDGDGYDDTLDLNKLVKDDYSFLDNETYYIRQSYYDNTTQLEYNLLSSLNLEFNINTEDDNQKFRFEWTGKGYKIIPFKDKSGNKVVTLKDNGTSYDVILDNNTPGSSKQLWEILPAFVKSASSNKSDSLIIRSKYSVKTSTGNSSLFLTVDSGKLKAIEDINNINNFVLCSPYNWTRFGEAYMNYYHWEYTDKNTYLSTTSFHNYTYNKNIGIDKKDIIKSVNSNDVYIHQRSANFQKLQYGNYPVSYSGCGIIATYNAMRCANINVDFFKLLLEFEYNAVNNNPNIAIKLVSELALSNVTSELLLSFIVVAVLDNPLDKYINKKWFGGWGSSVSDIGICLDAYDIKYTTYTSNNYKTNSSTRNYSKLCTDSDNSLKSGTSNIFFITLMEQFALPLTSGFYKAHYFCEEYDSSTNEIRGYNYNTTSTVLEKDLSTFSLLNSCKDDYPAVIYTID